MTETTEHTKQNGAWVLLAETRAVRVYGKRRPASFREVLNDRERERGNAPANSADKTNHAEPRHD